jgi:hypothetical protein
MPHDLQGGGKRVLAMTLILFGPHGFRGPGCITNTGEGSTTTARAAKLAESLPLPFYLES